MKNEGHTLDEWMQKLLPYVLLIFTLLILAGVSVECKASINENLEYHKNNFTSNEWFDVMQNVVINTTIGKMHLVNIPLVGYIEEDLTTWTEEDGLGALTIDEDTITTTNANFRYNTNTWLVKDSLGSFNDFEVIYKINVDTMQTSSSIIRVTLSQVCDDLEDARTIFSASGHVFGIFLCGLNDFQTWYPLLFEYHDGVSESSNFTSNVLSVDTDYWLKYVREDTLLRLYVYDEETYSNLIHSISLTLSTDYQDKRYFMALANVGYASSISTKLWIYDLAFKGFGSVTAPLGYAYTKDLLENTTEIGHSILLNQTIGDICDYQLYISEDNITWNLLIDSSLTGYEFREIEAYDYTSLYCKFVLNSNEINNVFINDFWFMNLLGDVGISTDNNEWFIAIIFICVPLLFVLGIVLVKRR